MDIPGAGLAVLRPWPPVQGLRTWLTPLRLLGIVGPLVAGLAVVLWLSRYPLLDLKALTLLILPWASIGLALGYLWVCFRSARIEVSPMAVRLIGPFGGSRAISRPDIAEVRQISVLAGRGQSQPVGLILDRGGRCLTRIRPGYDLEALAQALGRELSGSLDEPLTWQEARHRFPGSLPYAPSRTVGILFGFGIGLAVVAAIAIRVIL